MTKTKRKPTTHLEVSRRGGAASTPAQNEARKRNAQLAGRPKRVCNHCGERVRGGHVDQALDTKCGAHGWHWQKPHEAVSTTPTPIDAIAAILNDPSLTNDGMIELITDAVRATGRKVP